MPADEGYTDDEVRAIIDRALRNQPGRELSHEELLAVAAEVGISASSLEQAATEVRDARVSEAATQRILARRRRVFGSHAWAFAIVIGCLFAINFFTSPGQWWVAFPLVIWGLVVAFHARFAFTKHVSERALVREKRRVSEGTSYAPTAGRPVRVATAPPAASAEAEIDELELPAQRKQER
jgi:hypothetical protein